MASPFARNLLKFIGIVNILRFIGCPVCRVTIRDVLILEFWVRVCSVASASANQSRLASTSALLATIIMFKIFWIPVPAFNNVARIKNYKSN